MNSDEEHSYRRAAHPKPHSGTCSFVPVTSQVPRIYLCRQHHHKASKSARNVLCFRNFFFFFFLTSNCKQRVVIRKYYIALPGMSLQAKPVSHLGEFEKQTNTVTVFFFLMSLYNWSWARNFAFQQKPGLKKLDQQQSAINLEAIYPICNHLYQPLAIQELRKRSSFKENKLSVHIPIHAPYSFANSHLLLPQHLQWNHMLIALVIFIYHITKHQKRRNNCFVFFPQTISSKGLRENFPKLLQTRMQ